MTEDETKRELATEIVAMLRLKNKLTEERDELAKMLRDSLKVLSRTIQERDLALIGSAQKRGEIQELERRISGLVQERDAAIAERDAAIADEKKDADKTKVAIVERGAAIIQETRVLYMRPDGCKQGTCTHKKRVCSRCGELLRCFVLSHFCRG